jgi:hypothetical protein
MKTGYQTSTLLLVGSLALVTSWKAGHWQHIWTVLSTNQNSSGVSLQADLKPIGINLVGVAVITFIAGLSDDAGKMMIALSVGLWLLYLMSGGKTPDVLKNA